jgi:hypothetical protein
VMEAHGSGSFEASTLYTPVPSYEGAMDPGLDKKHVSNRYMERRDHAV